MTTRRTGPHRAQPGPTTPKEGVGADLLPPVRLQCDTCREGVTFTTEGCQCRKATDLGRYLGMLFTPIEVWCRVCETTCGDVIVTQVAPCSTWYEGDLLIREPMT